MVMEMLRNLFPQSKKKLSGLVDKVAFHVHILSIIEVCFPRLLYK